MQDRYRMYQDRLLLLYQRLRRDKTFSKPALAEADMDQNATYCQVGSVFLMHKSICPQPLALSA